MEKAFKFRIYPNAEQKSLLSKQFGAMRFVYNHFLARRKEEFLNNKKTVSYYSDAAVLTELKQSDGYDWLYDVNSQSLQAGLRNLDIAYRNFFRGNAKFPRFHKKSNDQCVKIPQHFSIKDGMLRIPKCKTGIDIRVHRELPEKRIALFISKTASGKYYASFLCDVEMAALPPSDKKIGIDLGLKHIVVSSEGWKVSAPKFYQKAEKEIAYHQKQYSKRKAGSKSQEKERIKLARLSEIVANQRKDFTHKLTRSIIDENQVIIAESLAVKNMMSNHCLAKSIGDAGWGELLRQLAYKSKWYGRTFYQIDRWFPSSKTCNGCQFVLESLDLKCREWDCPNCHQHNDRDINAARNVLNQGLIDLLGQSILSGSGIDSDIKEKLDEASANIDALRASTSRVDDSRSPLL